MVQYVKKWYIAATLESLLTAESRSLYKCASQSLLVCECESAYRRERRLEVEEIFRVEDGGCWGWGEGREGQRWLWDEEFNSRGDNVSKLDCTRSLDDTAHVYLRKKLTALCDLLAAQLSKPLITGINQGGGSRKPSQLLLYNMLLHNMEATLKHHSSWNE